ncbi:MAG: DUF5615 family PIN-like protein [Thermoguttaceae bacterium]
MKLLLDMNLSPRLATLFREAGYECHHWSEVGEPTAEDFIILRWAQENQFVVVTHDLDFGAILAATGFESPSVVQIRRQNIMPDVIFPRLIALLDICRQQIQSGSLVVFDERKYRIRILPLK